MTIVFFYFVGSLNNKIYNNTVLFTNSDQETCEHVAKRLGNIYNIGGLFDIKWSTIS
jgi:hypothetical protein